MGKRKNFYIPFDKKVEKYLRKGEFLGSGHNGIVYSLPKNRVIKVFNDPKVCKREYDILRRTRKSKYFPKVYDVGKNFIVREMVHGKRLDKYLKKNKMNKKLAHKLVGLIKEFKRLKFTKLDIRCKDIYLCDNGYLIIIDPKNNYTKKVNYPRHLMKGLKSFSALNDFLKYVKEYDEELYDYWSFRFKLYIEKKIK